MTFSKGLAGVIADTTQISQVQGEDGRLIYRGISIDELANQSSFEEVSYFLLKGKLPNPSELSSWTDKLKKYRKLDSDVEKALLSLPTDMHPMVALQALLAVLIHKEKPAQLKDKEAHIETSAFLISQLATLIAQVSRRRRGLPLLPVKDSLSHTSHFLYLLQGKDPDAKIAHFFDVAMILHMDHDFNASTFAARVIASTEAHLTSAISGAIGALSGPLHGGANERVLDMADAIKSPDKASAWILETLQKKGKVMGFGHRVYRTLDPRAKILKEILDTLAKDSKTPDVTFDILKKVHDTMIEELSKKEKDYIWPNVDFWSGSFYRNIGIEKIDFTPLFALARVVGWSSHVIEMWEDNRIYRPAAEYVGPDHVPYTKVK